MESLDYSLINSSNLFSQSNDFLYYYNNMDTLLKLVPNSVEYYSRLREKNLDHCNLPIDIYEVNSAFISSDRLGRECKCAITIPLLVDYVNMDVCDAFLNMRTTDMLKLLKKQMLSLKSIHNNKVYHGDISSMNILMNQKLDYQFIDFDLGSVDSCISVLNVYKDDPDNFTRNMTNCDKLDLLFIYLKRLLGIKQSCGIECERLKYLFMPEKIIDLIVKYAKYKNIPNDYYFIDIIDYLIESKYDSYFVTAMSKIKR